mmetsp:Transcript_3320/g.2773  ORF Transcript_3320/g.2773 Transcript_3320/m.2773 type:complete len:215 (-) Transcript_3320:77-721(-)
MTAVGLVEMVTKDKGTSVILSAAASQLGKMMIRLFSQENITVIGTVRKEAQKEELYATFKDEVKGNEPKLIVLNTGEEGFLQDYKKTITDLETHHLLECIGGSMSGVLTSALPPKSQVYLYGALARENISEIDPFSIINNQIVYQGFLLTHYIEGKNLLQLMMLVRKVKKLLREELSSEIQKEFDLKDLKEAIKFYESNMSGGKVILKPWGVEN